MNGRSLRSRLSFIRPGWSNPLRDRRTSADGRRALRDKFLVAHPGLLVATDYRYGKLDIELA